MSDLVPGSSVRLVEWVEVRARALALVSQITRLMNVEPMLSGRQALEIHVDMDPSGHLGKLDGSGASNARIGYHTDCYSFHRYSKIHIHNL